MSYPKKILIIDDERDFCDLIVMMLQREPFHVDCAYSISEASQFLKKDHPAIVLLDYNLPDGSGLDFFKHSKADFDDAKIILISADPSPDMKQRAQDAGIQYLAKPFGLKKIRDMIHMVT